MEPRPKIDNAMELEAARIVAEKIGRGATAEAIADHYSYPMDGYDLAKQLDRHEFWDTTRAEMEILDEMDVFVSRAERKAEKEWFERNRPKPPFAIGTRIQWRDITGEITGISEHGHGKYLVKPDVSTIGDGRYLVNFEDAQPIAR